MKKNMIPVICLILVLAFVIGCGGGGSASDKIIGTWGVDIDSYLQTPEIKEQLEAFPEMEDLVREMFGVMTFEITADEIKVNAIGESESMPYKVVSSTSNSVDIEIEGETETITVISDTQIEITFEGQTIPLKRQ